MVWMFDSGLLAWILLGSWLLLRPGPWPALQRLLRLLAGYALALLVCWLLHRLLAHLGASVLTMLLLLPLAGLPGLALGAWAMGRALRQAASRPVAAMLLERPLARRVIAALVLLLWTSLSLVLDLLLVNGAAAASSGLARDLREHTLIARELLSERLAVEVPKARSPPQEEPGTLSIDSFLDATGTSTVMTFFQILHRLSAMDQDQRERVLTAFPAISAAAASPAVAAVLDDEPTTAQITRACHGSLPAVLALARNRRIARLFDDPLMRAAVQQLDLDRLRSALVRPDDRVSGLIWQQASVDSSLQLAAQLREPAGWSPPLAGSQLLWSQDVRFGIARTHLAAHPLAEELRLQTQGSCTCYLDGRRLPSRHRGMQELVVLPAGREQALVVLIYFDGPVPRSCHAELMRP